MKALALVVGEDRQVAGEQRDRGQDHADDPHDAAPRRDPRSLGRPHVDAQDSHARGLAGEPPEADQVDVEDGDPGERAQHDLDGADVDRDLAERLGDQGDHRADDEEARLHDRDVQGEGASAADDARVLRPRDAAVAGGRRPSRSAVAPFSPEAGSRTSGWGSRGARRRTRRAIRSANSSAVTVRLPRLVGDDVR